MEAEDREEKKKKPKNQPDSKKNTNSRYDTSHSPKCSVVTSVFKNYLLIPQVFRISEEVTLVL